MFYLPDTNVLILALSGQEPYASWLIENIKEKTLLLSAIVVAEYLSGATEDEEMAFRGVLEAIKVLPVDSVVAQTAAAYRREFARKKKKVWLFDCLLAATGKIYGAILVTLDRKDYPMKDVKVTADLRRNQ